MGVIRYMGYVELAENSLPDLGVSWVSPLASISHSPSSGGLHLKRALPV